MVFNYLNTILLGIIGGIISSLIVSRVFLIHSKYQEQLSFVNHIFRKIGYISAFLQSSKAIFEVSYDEEIRMEREMKEKGYKTEMEYYAAHRDKDWISKNDLLAEFRKKIIKKVDEIKADIADKHIEDEKLIVLLEDVVKYVSEVASVKEYTFSILASFAKKEQALLERANGCSQLSGHKLLKLVVKDKMMIILAAITFALIAGTIITGVLGI